MENTSMSFDNREFVSCPWCKKLGVTPPSKDNMVIVYNCLRCNHPMIFFNKKAYKMDEKLLSSNNPVLIEDYVLELLEKEGFDILEKKFEEIFEEEENDDENEDDNITIEEVVKMRIFLNNFKIPVEGDFL